jgi:GTP:adenosylcobinamide-phosphate guanylyltransferase
LESFTNVNRREDLARVERVLAERDAARREE